MSERFDIPKASLDQAKQWLRDRFEDGAECPCCRQHVQLYKRKLNAAMAVVLIYVYRWEMVRRLDKSRSAEVGGGDLGDHAPDATPYRQLGEYVHVPSYIAWAASGNPSQAAAIRGDWAKLKHWLLIEEMSGERADSSSRVGYYRITERGIAFVRGETRVPAHIWIYNETMLDRPVLETVSIHEALSIKFDYAALMEGR